MSSTRAFASLLVLLALASSACGKSNGSARSETAPACAPGDAAPIIDPALLAFLSRARAAHHAADLREEAGATSEALQALDAVVTGPVPGGDNPPPEAREVLADTRARMAELLSQLGRHDEGLKNVELGLALARETTYFRGHLFETRGLIEERRAKELATHGQAATATEATRAALQAFEEAMKIQAEVIENATPRGDH